jgi:hypothetical protein
LFAGSKLVLLSDQPVGEDGQEDLLDRSDAARQLAELIHASRSAAPFTLAVYADWGMGKSSLLRQVADQFADSQGVETVWFNAWTASRADALETLIKSVLDRLDPNALRRLARHVGGDTGAGAWARVTLSGLAGTVRMHHLVDEIWKQLSIDARARNETRDLLRSALRGWTAGDGRSGGGRMIVVFIDDLDRCAPDVIRAVCDAVKQYLSVPGLVFVLGCDQNVVETAVGDAGESASATIGRRYLEKIVQASYSIPIPTQEDAQALVDGYARRSGSQALFQGAVATAATRHAGRNPRRIKRLINRFVVEYRLDDEWRQFGPEALIRVILLQDFYPEFFSLLARGEDLDPIDEFTDYLAVLALGQPQNPSGSAPELDDEARLRVERSLREHGITVPGLDALPDDILTRVERELPPVYLTLARDKTFVGLVSELADSSNGEQFRAKIRRRRHAAAAVGAPLYSEFGPRYPEQTAARGFGAASEAIEYAYPQYPQFAQPGSRHGAPGYPATPWEAASAPGGGHADADLNGLNVLWLNTSHPVSADISIPEIIRRGARVDWAETGDEAIRALAVHRPDVVVANVSRAGDRDSGFGDLVRIREATDYSGPLIAYTSVLTPARQEGAARLGVRITDRFDVLTTWLGSITTSVVQDLAGVKFLWLTAARGSTEDERRRVRSLEARGAQISRASNRGDAMLVIAEDRPHAVVTSLWRGDDNTDGGFDDVDFLRREGRFDGPILVYVNFVSTARARRADQLGVDITSEFDEFTAWLTRHAVAFRGLRPTLPPRRDPVGTAHTDDYVTLRRAAEAFARLGDIDKAEQRWDTARDLAESANDVEGLVDAQLALGKIALSKKRFPLAISRLEYGRTRWPAGYDPDAYAELMRSLGDAYDGHGDDQSAAAARGRMSST